MSRCLASAAISVGLQRVSVSQHGDGPLCDCAHQLVDPRHDAGFASIGDPAVERRRSRWLRLFDHPERVKRGRAARMDCGSGQGVAFTRGCVATSTLIPVARGSSGHEVLAMKAVAM
jgi:hypothetical protein